LGTAWTIFGFRGSPLYFSLEELHKLNTLMFPKHAVPLGCADTASERSNQRPERQTEGWWQREIIFESAFFGSLKLGVNNHSNLSQNLKLVRPGFTSSSTTQPQSGRQRI